MENQPVTILLTSCDKYADAWEPFFQLWNLNWPDCQYPFVLNSETKDFQTNLFPLTTVKGGEGIPWSKRLKNCLKTIETEYVLLCLEDYFLQAPVNTEIFHAALQTMTSHPEIGVIQFTIDIHAKYDETVNVNQYFSPVPKYKKDRHNGRIYCVLSLYRTGYLRKLLLSTESPWEFEMFGSIRSQYFREKVYRENENHSRCFTYFIEPKFGYAISRGKWLPKNEELFSRYHIEVDFSNLGILTSEEYQELLTEYYGKRIKREREHHTLVEKICMPISNPKLFHTILKEYLKNKKIEYKVKIKLKIPFLP